MESLTITDQLTALGDRTRLRLLRVLERQELTVAELCEVLQLPQSTVSRHLRVLADHGWLSSRPEGTSRYYRFHRAAVEPAQAKLWTAIATDLVDGADDRRLPAVLAERHARARAFFATAASGWDRLRRDLFGDRGMLLAIGGLLDASWTVGDLGCGTGQTLAALAPWVERAVGVDSSPEMLAAARERVGGARNVELRQGELESLPVADGELDAAIMVLVLHYLPAPERALLEVARALRPGGRLLVVDLLPHEREELREQMGHVWLGFEPAALGDRLAAAGFEGTRTVTLPHEPSARGPALFAAAALRGDSLPNHPLRRAATAERTTRRVR